MNNEFKKINNNNITRYVLEDGSSGGATSGGTSAGSISSFEKPMGGIQRRTGDDLIHQENKKSYKVSHKPKNPVAKAHQTVGTGSGAHTDKTKVIPRKEKHKKTADMTLENFNAEYDDEAGMADNNLETMKRAVDGLDSLIHKGDNLPEWCQEKIAVAKSMLVAVWDYMQSEEHGMAEGDDSFQSQFDKKNAKVMKPANPVQFVKREINNNCERDGCAPGELNRNILAGIAQQSGLSLRDVLRIRNMMDPVMQQGVAEGVEGSIDLLKKLDAMIKNFVQTRGQMGGQRLSAGMLPILNNLEQLGEKDIAQGIKSMVLDARNKEQTTKGASWSVFAQGLSQKLPELIRTRMQSAQQPARPAPGVAEGNRGYAHGFASPTAPQLGQKRRDSDSGDSEPEGMFMVMIDGRPWKEFTSNMAFDRAKAFATKNPDRKVQVRWPSGQLNTVKEDNYMESLNAKLAEKLDPNAEPEVWVQDFQKANPNKYHQFKNKTPQKKAQMAVAARRDARLKK